MKLPQEGIADKVGSPVASPTDILNELRAALHRINTSARVWLTAAVARP